MDTYKILRYFQMDKDPIVIKTGLTLAEAKEHCNDPETQSRTATLPEAVAFTEEYGDWFDGFTIEDTGGIGLFFLDDDDEDEAEQ